MELSIPPVLTYLASWLSLTGGVWALFDRAETVATGETKSAVSRWLRNLDPVGHLVQWPAGFAAVFDTVFGERHLSWRCFWRSCLASVASAAIVTGIWAMLRPREAIAFFAKDLAGNAPLALTIIVLSLVINTIPDYLSLLKTRYVIQWTGKSSWIGRTAGLFVLDLLVTALIASAVIVLVASRVHITIAGVPRGPVSLERAGEFVVKRVLPLTAEEFIPVLVQVDVFLPREALETAASQIERELLGERGARAPGAGSQEARSSSRPKPAIVYMRGIPWGIFFYSTFFTSVWVWLYGKSSRFPV